MIELNLSTVLMLHVSVLLAGCGAFFHFRRLGVKPGALTWLGMGYGTQALGAFLAAMGAQNRLATEVWEGASLWLGITGYGLLWAGLCRLSRGHKRARDGWIVVVVPLGCLVLAAATGSLALDLRRATIFHLASLGFLSAAALNIHRDDAAEPLRSRTLLTALLVVFALSFLLGLALILAGVAPPERLALVFFVQILCYFALALFVSGLLTERLAADLRGLAERDPLTGLGNRARLDHLLPLTPEAGMAAIMLDIDHFKRINDRHGHLAGDKVLSALGHLLRTELRESDPCIRFGGEEFLIMVKEADALQLAERLRVRLAAHELELGLDKPLRITASFGIAVNGPCPSTWGTLIAAADHALYEAKAAGRNRVVVAEPSSFATGAVTG
ncbi:GGDEF domain-containing protein [Aquabacter sp. L1I39]|uniref:GGDEF domain-containing protein n=1 Tax=Aquabacter sp. L1I39 TaxID=2820278 RepID=UPI001ADBE30A|nr:GGDEF domain-containing protein [Aquabacter sp. L1I39]QTL03258.1 GGDEF domain-containing protein [Aquabacter sp. L1I39]